jgi:hypothetical protein
MTHILQTLLLMQHNARSLVEQMVFSLAGMKGYFKDAVNQKLSRYGSQKALID